jgi:UDP-2,4-diacetamido-2,4,6-trideoxy-beta-L-altropyranose hydrolase
MMKILFRTNGGSKLGLGHLFRSINLAYAILSIDNTTEIIFNVNKDAINFIHKFEIVVSDNFDEKNIQIIKNLKPNLVIFDSYLANTYYLEKLRKISTLAMFDDNNDLYGDVVSHFILNGNIFANNLKYISKYSDTQFLLGPKHLVMRKEYWCNNNLEDQAEKPKGILITSGGSNLHGIMDSFIKNLQNLPILKKIIIGPSFSDDEIENIIAATENNDTFELVFKPNSLKNYILNSEIVISAAGSTVYEVLALNRIPILFELAKNQHLIAEEMAENGVNCLGIYDSIHWDEVSSIIQDIIKNKTTIEKKLAHLFNLIDGQGAYRVAERLLGIDKK